MIVESLLLDARSPQSYWDRAFADMAVEGKLLGLDCETQDEDRHAGLNLFNNGNRHVFDHRRTTMTGFSFYAEGSGRAWYVNLAHADVENRVPRERALELLAARRPETLVIAHNAPFELVMFKQCLDLALENIACSMQLAVSAHGPDEYDLTAFYAQPLYGLKKLLPQILTAFRAYDPETRGRKLTSEQAELLGKFIAKESEAAHSYNGFVDTVAYGYGLKQLVERLFGHKLTTFKDLLKAYGATHMGQLTGEQVVAYGADDAYWCVQVWKDRVKYLQENCPSALVANIRQEQPMIHVFADAWREGLRINRDAVFNGARRERANFARALRDLKALVKSLLPFGPGPMPEGERKALEAAGQKRGAFAIVDQLASLQPWYQKNWAKYRRQVEVWANLPDSDDDFEQLAQIRSPLSIAWAAELDAPEPMGVNLGHYMPGRVLLYDLLQHRLVFDDGELSSDKNARGRMLEHFDTAGQQVHADILRLLQHMSSIETTMKLYINNYTLLLDPETERMYPTLRSDLATRRLGMSFPNGMALTKRGEAKYVRGFYLADSEDHLVLSADWASVELVLIGDQSGDPGFAKVYGQKPYGDMHSMAAVEALKVKWFPDLTDEEFKGFKFGDNPNGRIFKNFKGDELKPQDFYSFARSTDIGKGISFGYWYSGALSTVANNMGLTDEEHWALVDLYRSRFSVAEAWRVGVIEQGRDQGFVMLPDGHRRVRFESTAEWHRAMMRKFADLTAAPALQHYAELALRRLQSRSGNQLVNAKIQGTCATLAKRTIVRMEREIRARGWDKLVGGVPLARFMMPIHDELVYSVHRDIAMEFIAVFRAAMCEHPDIVKTLPLDCSVAVGKTFKPFDGTGLGQIELDEAQVIDNVVPFELRGQKLPDDVVRRVIEFAADTRIAA